MPRYEYICDACNEDFEVQRPMAHAGDPVTHRCGKTATRVWRSTPPVNVRPEGYDLSPEDPKYFSTLKDKDIQRWQH